MKTELGRLIFKALTKWTPVPNDNPLEGFKHMAIIGMGFASNDRNDPKRTPGASNDDIARIIAYLWFEAQRLGVNVYVLVQREVAESLRLNYPPVRISKSLEEVGDEAHISSDAIMGQAWDFASRIGITDSIVVAHKRHALRCGWNAEMWGFTVRFPHRFPLSYTWHDRPSQTQWHTWNAPIYFFWEALSRAKLVLLDWRKYR